MEICSLLDELFPSKITKISSNHRLISPSFKLADRGERQRKILQDVINELGTASAMVQNLPQVVTSFAKFKYTDHRLYFIREPHNHDDPMPFGFLKVGKKKLFIFDSVGDFHEVDPLCVLDFYICGSYQRKGFGQCLFQFMLTEENLSAVDLAVDSPSDKMLSFMTKHYHLDSPLWQSNNFVVFPEFFRKLKLNVQPHSKFYVPPLLQKSAYMPRRKDHLKKISNEKTLPLFSSGDLAPIGENFSSAMVNKLSLDKEICSPNQPHVYSSNVLNHLSVHPSPPESCLTSFGNDSASGNTCSNVQISPPHLAPTKPTELDTWRRLSSIPKTYSYQSAVRMHNKHTRLW